ncbi:MAG: NADH-quinone oxidoreductase subunit NuoK [Polyangia bacterium]|jgi:NADH-quinone oxidoreductase subunit K|nr:NADH-quinone oxidoreductase subunit NuoK [Polyangia bacterium]
MILSSHYLVLSAVLFMIGAAGVLLRRNVLVVMMSIELMLNSANLALITFSRVQGDAHGQALSFMVVAIAAAEVAVGLAIVVALYRSRRTTNIDDLDMMKQ